MNLDRGVRQLWIGLAAVDLGGSFLLLLVLIVMLVRKTNLDIIGRRKSGWLIQTEGWGPWHVLRLFGFYFFWKESMFRYISLISILFHLVDLSLLSFISSPLLLLLVCSEYFHFALCVGYPILVQAMETKKRKNVGDSGRFI